MAKVIGRIGRASRVLHPETARYFEGAASKSEDRVSIKCDDGWYEATIIGTKPGGKVHVIYDDGGYKEWLDPKVNEFKPSDKKASKGAKKGAKEAATKAAAIATERAKLKTMTQAADSARDALNRKKQRDKGSTSIDFTAEEEKVKALYAAQHAQFKKIQEMSK